MKLMTKDIEKKIPKLYDTENIPTEDKVAYVKYFNPINNWTWYGIEYDGEDTFLVMLKDSKMNLDISLYLNLNLLILKV